MKKQYKQLTVLILFIALSMAAAYFVFWGSAGKEENSISTDSAYLIRNGSLDMTDNKSGLRYWESTDAGKQEVNILLLGVEGKARTDTIMFIHYDVPENKLSIVSIPRDTYFHENGYNHGDQRKINAVYGRKGEEGCVAAVSKLLGDVPVDYYISVDYEGVEEIVDSISGVRLEVPMDMEAGGVKLSKGEQVLYGREALQYLRFRKKYKDGDLGRVKAQQKLIAAAFKKLQYMDIPKVMAKSFGSIRTNMTLGQMISYAKQLKKNKGNEMELYMLPGVPMYKAIEGYNWSYFFHNSKETSELMRKINKLESMEEKKRKRYELY